MTRKNVIVFATILLVTGLAQAHDHDGAASTVPSVTQAAEPQPASSRADLPDGSGAVKPRDIRTDLHELSPWSMFIAADALVKAVMISLALASLITWTVFFAKMILIARSGHHLQRSLADVAHAKTLTDTEQSAGPNVALLQSLLAAAQQEIQMSGAGSSASGIKERAASRFAEIIRSESRTMRTGMGALATIGATAPFIGLFGTVWGIMNSFIGISKAQTTNLAVVAPGIAEALLATAFGLAAAIPAVMLYNYLTRSLKGYLDLAADAAGTTGRLLSRTLEERKSRRGGLAKE